MTTLHVMAEAPPIPPGTGARIKARRNELELTQAQVADRVADIVGRNYREGWLAQIERGNASMLLNAAVALADVLAMSLDEMLGRTKRGPDIVLEAPDGQVVAVEIKAPMDDALAPVEALPTGEAAVQTRQAAAQRRQKRAAARPRST